MTLLEDFAEPMAFCLDETGIYLIGEFPQVLRIADDLLEHADPRFLERRGDQVHFWLRNGHAAYEVKGPSVEMPGSHVLLRKGR